MKKDNAITAVNAITLFLDEHGNPDRVKVGSVETKVSSALGKVETDGWEVKSSKNGKEYYQTKNDWEVTLSFNVAGWATILDIEDTGCIHECQRKLNLPTSKRRDISA